jgi:Tfp pilus assembly protein PilX
MCKLIKPLKNEDGYFLIIFTMMLLALLTIISIAASNTARTEVQIAANDLIYQRNFYLAEGAVIEAVDQLLNDPNPRDLAFVVPGLKAIDDSTYKDYWDTDPGAKKVTTTLDTSQKTRYVAGYEGTPTGYSLGMGKPRVHAFTIYGRTEKQGVTTIKVGFLKAF